MSTTENDISGTTTVGAYVEDVPKNGQGSNSKIKRQGTKR